MVKITETECYECDYVENCEWGVILANSTCISPPCVAKQWHEKSMKTFADMTYAIREKIEGGGEVVKARSKISPPLGFKGIDQTDEGWT